ncbi:hypothetical protein SAMN05216266_101737 [Amycolatopsis marina]|uniref:Uncharacterized protein n=1 Tax=Amycolatopsis marina TaxID=490629 RepID=A0A1I0W4F2_9PSEU|nr:hypothetical protein [Amycolatopsis marina]SFA83625.1 hypothetical protein SAMN05216266_101737 [Amycolatopsis marina]
MSGPQDAEDPLGEELRTLFADDRLDLHPVPQARASIVSGARRIRRRRTALSGGGAAVVVALVASTVLFNNRTPGEDAPPAGSDTALAIESAAPTPTSARIESGSAELPPPPDVADEPRADSSGKPQGSVASSAPASPESTFQAVSGPVLGPDGYGGLRLGMSFSDAAATGELAVDASTAPPAEGCGSYQLTEGDSAVREVVVSAEQGIVTFSASAAQTPEGIGAGSRLEQLRQAYPKAARGSVTYSAPTGSGGSYVFYVAGEQVDSMQLIAEAVPC